MNPNQIVPEEVAIFDEVQITHQDNRSNPGPGDPCPTLSKHSRPTLFNAEGSEVATLTKSNLDKHVINQTPLLVDPLASEPRFARNDRGAPGEVVPPLKAQSGTTGKGDAAPCVVVNVGVVNTEHGLAPHGSMKLRDICPEVTANEGKGKTAVLAFSSKDHGADATEDLAPTLRAMGHDKSHANAGGQLAVAFKASHYTRGKDGAPSETYPPLQADADKGDQDPLILQTAVRRLTPRECERLMGIPDDFTQIAWRGKKPEDCPDGPRYKALGNSMAVPVVRWIGERIEAVDKLDAVE